MNVNNKQPVEINVKLSVKQETTIAVHRALMHKAL